MVKLSPIAYDSSLLPSTEARTLFQFQCGCTFVKTSYRSSLVGHYPTNNFTLANRSCSESIFFNIRYLLLRAACLKSYAYSELQVTFQCVLLTRSPLKSHDSLLKEKVFSFDSHVLGAFLAFILSRNRLVSFF